MLQLTDAPEVEGTGPDAVQPRSRFGAFHPKSTRRALLLTALEVYMIVHIAKTHEANLGLKEIGYSAVTLYGVSTVLKDAALEILTFVPVIGWGSEVIVAILFVFFLR